MSPIEPARMRGATCRADLLRVLATAPRDTLTLDVDASGWFGYQRRAEQPAPTPKFAIVGDPGAVTIGPGPERKPLLRLPLLPAIVRREARQPPERDAGADAAYDDAAPIDESTAQAPSDQRLIAFQDLVPPPRLLPALRRLLGASRTGPLDVERLTQLLAASQLPRRLPRRVYRRWHPDLVVLLDFCPRLWPYRWDMHQLAERLLRHTGQSGVSLRIINRGPFGSWSDWLAHNKSQIGAMPVDHPWRMPPAETPVLVVSDLGMLLGPQSALAQAWAAFIKGLIRAELRPVALVPLGAGQLGEPVPPALPILRWSPDARPRPTRAHGRAVPQPDGLDDLLAMVAATRRVDPPLLRAMRQLGPKAPLNAGLEGALWCHADVDAAHTASVRVGARDAYLRHFRDRLKDLQVDVERQRAKHHAHLRAALNHEETLLWAAQVGDETVDSLDGARQRVAQARNFMLRLAATLAAPGASHDWLGVAGGITSRADDRMWRLCRDELHRLVAAQVRVRGPNIPIPDHADPAMLKGLLASNRPATSCWLVRDAASGCLVLQPDPAGTRQSALGEAITMDAGGTRVTAAGGGHARWLSAEALPVQLARLSEPAVLHIETAGESVLIAPVRRPLGALGWSCDRTGIGVRSAPFDLWQMSWSGSQMRAVAVEATDPAPTRWALEADPVLHDGAKGALHFGIDRRFGVYADLTVTTTHASATQRLRWIPPGRFLMGSPDWEEGRDDDEGPRRKVTLAEGFWLFDTPCTQALWEAVMGKNPSRFKSPTRPVEQVSFDDVQSFLGKLNTLVPGLGLTLPSEAQWEYACRAGTDTATYAGDMRIAGERNAPVLDAIAWYGGNSGVGFELDDGYDSSGWAEKQYAHTRAGTRPVAQKAANPWGLYDMLGNVWEWCGDHWHGSYTGAPADGSAWISEDQGGAASRVIRGGSWRGLARDVRAAFRDRFGPAFRDVFLGFRCARVQSDSEVSETEGRAGRSKRRERSDQAATTSPKRGVVDRPRGKRKPT